MVAFYPLFPSQSKFVKCFCILALIYSTVGHLELQKWPCLQSWDLFLQLRNCKISSLSWSGEVRDSEIAEPFRPSFHVYMEKPGKHLTGHGFISAGGERAERPMLDRKSHALHYMCRKLCCTSFSSFTLSVVFVRDGSPRQDAVSIDHGYKQS